MKTQSNQYWLAKAAEWRKANPHITKPRTQIGMYKKEHVYAAREYKGAL